MLALVILISYSSQIFEKMFNNKHIRARENTVPDFLFVNHHAGSREDFSRIVSHARRMQHTRKQRQQDSTAKKNAIYARSLVGWQRPGEVVDEPIVSITTHVHVHPTAEVEQTDEIVVTSAVRQQLVNSTILTPVDTGLRMDPFGAFPTDNSRQTKEMVDFVSLISTYQYMERRWAIGLEEAHFVLLTST